MLQMAEMQADSQTRAFVPRTPTCRFFYKYSNADHLEWLRDILINHQVYFPSHVQLNDPRDGWPALRTIPLAEIVAFLVNDFIRRNPGAAPAWLADEVARIVTFSEGRGAVSVLRLMEDSLKREMERNRIYSLSMAADDKHMWETYGGRHTGYCLEFVNEGLFAYAREVDYDDALIEMDVGDPTGMFFFRKTQKWKDEREARIVMLPRADAFRAMFPNGENPFVKFEPSLLRHVILGARMTAASREMIRAWAVERNPPVPVEVAGVQESVAPVQPAG
jgi:hypothetical protein